MHSTTTTTTTTAINYSLSTEAVASSIFKIGEISPVFKDVDKDSFSNYRPISVPPSFSKVYEKVFANILRSYLVQIF